MAMTGGTAKLVKTTYPFSDSSKAVNLYIYYKSTQDVNTNKSTIYCGMYVTTPSGWNIGQWDDWNATSYVGTTSNTFDGTVPNFSGTRWIAENKTFTVDHNPDGTGTATIQWKWAVNSPWGGYVNPSGSFSITLPQIPRATTPTLSASSVQMGKSVTVTMNRASSSFTHTLEYTIGSTTNIIASGLGTSYSWTVPDLVSLIPNATSGTATITCTTYSGTTKVGTKTAQISISAYDATAPTITGTPRMGESCTVNTSRASSKYTHNLTYTMGSQSGTIASGVGASVKFPIPATLVTEVNNAVSGNMVITCVTMNGTAIVGTKQLSVSVGVPKASVPSPMSGSGIMGETIGINTNRMVSKYTHILRYTFGTKTGYVSQSAGHSIEWDIPLSLASEIPNASSGTVTISCETKNGTATVGTETCTFTLSVPDNELTKPSFSMAFTPVHSLPSDFAGLYVQGKTKVGVTFDANSEYALVKSYSVKIGGTTFAGESVVSNFLTSSGSISIEGTVTDSRGYSRTHTQYITVIPYERPRLAVYSGENNIVCTRSSRDGVISPNAEYVLVKASAAYSEVIHHNKAYNKCRMWYRYKTAGASDYSMNWVQFDGTEVSFIPDAIFNVKTAYTFQLKVEDDVGEERVYTYPIPYVSIPLHLGKGGKNLGLGQFCDYSEEDRIDVGWKTYFNDGIGRKVIFEADDVSSGWSSGEVLNDVVTEADTTMIGNYNLFIATAISGLVGDAYPVLCVRHNNIICGISDLIELRIAYYPSGGSLRLNSITSGYTITALYALL